MVDATRYWVGRWVRTLLALGLGLAVLVSGTDVRAQSTNDMLNRIKRLETDINDLHRHLFGGGKKPTAAITATPVEGTSLTPSASGTLETSTAARTEIRLQQLEALVRNLTGKAEELDFNLTQLAGRIDTLVSDLDRRFAALESRAPVAGAAAPTAEPARDPASGGAGTARAAASTETTESGAAEKQTAGVLGYLNQKDLRKLEADRNANQQAAASAATAAPKAPDTAAQPTQAAAVPAAVSGPVLPEGDASTRYQHAFGYLMRHDYETAEMAFNEFIKAHGDDPLAGNAVYWLGETYYVREKFAEAAVTFAEGYEKYPGSPKTADNLLKLGFALARLQRTEDACVALAQLRDEFPNASTTIKRRALNEGKRIGCKG